MPSASEEVADRLRARIVAGAWAPGSRLPSRNRLARDLGSCLATLQEAMARMVEEGFIEVGPRKMGTFVAAHPPHLTRYRLIFPFGPDDWGQFWHALESAARQRAAHGQEFLCFYGLSGHRDIAEYREVVKEAQTKRVAGLIFASSADQLLGTPLLDQPGLPRAAIATEGQLPGIPKVYVDHRSFLDRAVKHLLAAGRRRIALLAASHALGIHGIFREVLEKHGLASRRCWEQFASPHQPVAASHLMELLFQPGQSEPPDGLIIADDNLIAAATDGIRRAGTPVPDRLAIVAITNFPHLLPAAVPVTRLGFDIPALLDLLVTRLHQLARGETPPECTRLPAYFDHELQPTGANQCPPLGKSKIQNRESRIDSP